MNGNVLEVTNKINELVINSTELWDVNTDYFTKRIILSSIVSKVTGLVAKNDGDEVSQIVDKLCEKYSIYDTDIETDDLSDSNFDEDDEETYITFGDFKEIIKAANKISKEDLGVSLKEITNDEDFEDALMAGCDYMGISFGVIVKSKGKTVKELAFETFGFEI